MDALIEDHGLYFLADPGAILVAVGDLEPTKAPDTQPASVERAESLMRRAAAGKTPRRAPISVTRTARGYSIRDGNATYGVALRHGWQTLPAVVHENSASPAWSPAPRVLRVSRVPDEPPFVLMCAVSACPVCGYLIEARATGLGEAEAATRARGEHAELLGLHRASHHGPEPIVESAAGLGAGCVPLQSIAGVPTEGKERRLDSGRQRSWTVVFCPADGRETLVPTETALLWTPDHESLLIREPLSTGTAAHTDAERASQAALLELLERDAFMRAVAGRTRPHRLVAASQTATQLMRMGDRYRLRVDVFELDTHAGALTVMALMSDQTKYGPAVTCGLACGWSLDSLVVKATQEAWQPRLWLRATMTKAAGRPRTRLDVTDAQARGLFWSDPSRLPAIADLVRLPPDPPSPDPPSASAEELLARLGDSGIEVFCVYAEQTNDIALRRFMSPQLLPLVLNEELSYTSVGDGLIPAPHFFL